MLGLMKSGMLVREFQMHAPPRTYIVVSVH